jgi:hypothetical protein
MTPDSEVMVRVRARDHLGMDVAADAKLNTNVLLLDRLSKLFFHVNNVTQSIGFPR